MLNLRPAIDMDVMNFAIRDLTPRNRWNVALEQDDVEAIRMAAIKQESANEQDE